jgi:hypothetical protein
VRPLRRRLVNPPSEAERRKVAGRPCLVCARRPVDPVDLGPVRLAGATMPIASCRCAGAARAYDRGELDVLPHLDAGYRVELAHALRHVSLLAL